MELFSQQFSKCINLCTSCVCVLYGHTLQKFSNCVLKSNSYKWKLCCRTQHNVHCPLTTFMHCHFLCTMLNMNMCSIYAIQLEISIFITQLLPLPLPEHQSVLATQCSWNVRGMYASKLMRNISVFNYRFNGFYT